MTLPLAVLEKMSLAKQIKKAVVDPISFNTAAILPYNLRSDDSKAAMQDVYVLLARHQ
jgi:hypothetical protein